MVDQLNDGDISYADVLKTFSKIDMKNLDLTRLEKMEMKDIEGLVRFSKISRAYSV